MREQNVDEIDYMKLLSFMAISLENFSAKCKHAFWSKWHSIVSNVALGIFAQINAFDYKQTFTTCTIN